MRIQEFAGSKAIAEKTEAATTIRKMVTSTTCFRIFKNSFCFTHYPRFAIQRVHISGFRFARIFEKKIIAKVFAEGLFGNRLVSADRYVHIFEISFHHVVGT